MKISIENRHPGYRIDVPAVRRIIGAAATGAAGGVGAAGIGCVFLDDRGIRRLNRRYKRRDRPTDVLSFPLDGYGEIYISIDRAVIQARRFGVPAAEELARYVIHGILHLAGYDDGTPRERERMSRKEDEVLRWLSRNGRSTRVLTRR